MMKSIQRIVLAGMGFFVLALAITSAGCAGPRKGPFDIPGPAPATDPSATEKLVRVSDTDDSLAFAAAEIAAARVYFDFDRAVIRPDAYPTLDRVAALLRQYPAIGINIEGHCDARGGREYNYALGERRAREVYGYLLARGIDPAQVYMVTYGKEEPAVYGSTENAYAHNRRVVLAIVTTCRQ